MRPLFGRGPQAVSGAGERLVRDFDELAIEAPGSVALLPVAYRARIDMDEYRARVETASTHAQRAPHLPDLEPRHAGHADVHRVAVHVLAVAGHAAADARQPGVGGGRTIGRGGLDGER